MSDDLIPPDVRSNYEPGKLVVIPRNPTLPPIPPGDAGGVVESVDENAGTFVIKDVLPHGPVLTPREAASYAMPFTHPDRSIARILQIWHATARAQAQYMAKVRPALWLTTKAMPEGLR